jgi:hypothetical protein
VTTIAALYIDPSGIYADVPDVELWDEQRDALIAMARSVRESKAALRGDVQDDE